MCFLGFTFGLYALCALWFHERQAETMPRQKHFCILGRGPASKNPVNIFQNAFVMRRITLSEYFFFKR